MNFKVGDKVRARSGMDIVSFYHNLEKGRIYTISSIHDGFVYLDEVKYRSYHLYRFELVNINIPKTEIEYYSWLAERLK